MKTKQSTKPAQPKHAIDRVMLEAAVRGANDAEILPPAQRRAQRVRAEQVEQARRGGF